jgi:hypothetical protein
MYTTCLFCNSDLRRNQALEHFPVGRRLAYDAAKGRLWVVCSRALTVLSGDDALRAAGQLLPKLNAAGARAPQVQSAVRLIEEVGDPVKMVAIQAARGRPSPRSRRTPARGLAIGELSTEVRVALEMAAHEEAERRALEGELALLEEAWRDAEEIAAIADDMFLPEGTADRLETLRREAREH